MVGAAVQGRLRRDRPDIYAGVLAGEISVPWSKHLAVRKQVSSRQLAARWWRRLMPAVERRHLDVPPVDGHRRRLLRSGRHQ